MNPVFRRVARIITWVSIVVAALFWIYTIVGWFITEPGFEPLNVLISTVITGLSAIFIWIGRKTVEFAKRVRFTLLSGGTSLNAGGIKFAEGQFSLRSELVIDFYAKMCTHNPGLPASAMLTIASIEPISLSGCLPDGSLLKDINVVIKYRKHPNWASTDLGNPFQIDPGDLNIDVSAKIPFNVAKIEHTYGAIASLKEATLIFRVDFEATRQHLQIDPLRVDLTPVHKQIEADVTSNIPKYQVRSTQAIDTEQLVQTLKRYWLGETGH